MERCEVIEGEGYGILNAVGQFWSTKVFVTQGDARTYIDAFWGSNIESAKSCHRTHKIVPVTYVMTFQPKQESKQDD